MIGALLQFVLILSIYIYWQRRAVLAWLRRFPGGWWTFDTPTAEVRAAVFELAAIQATCILVVGAFVILVRLFSAAS